MKIYFLIAALSIHFFSAAQDIKVFHETMEDKSIRLNARNNTDFEQSVKVEATYKGMEASESLPLTKVLAPGATVYFATLKPVEGSYSYNYKYSYIQGDVTADHNDDHVYRLPFEKGKEFLVGQSYNERPTHMDQYALDFNMDESTEITAIRDGVVIRIVQNHSKGCPKEECTKFNNFVLVKHDDGSVADYSHIKKNGALVKVGDKVRSGQPIALSGATGWASGAHLHLEVYVMSFSGQKSVKASYHLDSKTIGIPESGQKYQQDF